jgi:small GTP-binding protein
METLKVCVVGDGAVGKTCMLTCYATGQCPGEYVPTIFDNFDRTVLVDGKLASLSLWDTAGQEDYDRLRPLSYPGTDVFLVCFSLTSLASLANLEHKWIPELAQHNVPVVMVGTKADLEHRVLKHQAEQVMWASGAKAYVECSAYTQEGLNDVFETVVRVGRDHRADAILKKKKTGRRCVMS